MPALRLFLSRWSPFNQGLALIAAMLIADRSAEGQDKKAPEIKGQAAADLIRLKREVDALETLYQLEPTDAQLTGLLALAQKTAAKPNAVMSVRAGEDYRKTLQEIRNALVKNDEAQVTALFAKLAEIEEKEAIDIEESFDLTDASFKAAPAALRLFTAAQVVSYLAAMENEVPDPVERVLETFVEGQDLPADEWKELRDEVAEEVAWLVVGFNSDAAKAKAKEVAELLDRGHRLTEKDFEKEHANLEKAARKLTGEVSPMVVLQHYMERELAEFLSNPQAVVAIKARKEQLKK